MGRSLNRRIAKQFGDIDGWPPTDGEPLPPMASPEAVIRTAVNAGAKERLEPEAQPPKHKSI
jgi:hypothetical protein